MLSTSWNQKMDLTYWHKQSNKPLFPDILWSRPETKQGAGKLAIIGGNSHGFGAPGIAYNRAMEAGAGTIKVVLPDAVRKVVHNLLPEAEYSSSTPSGSFSTKSLEHLLSVASWSDMVLLAGDFGRNSDSAIVLEKFISKYTGPLTITQDTIDYFKEIPLNLTDRDNTIVVLSISQLQKLFMNTPVISPIVLSMSSLQLVDALHNYTDKHSCCIITKHNDLIFVAYKGMVSTTKCEDKIWRVATSAKASVFVMQNPTKIFEAVTSSLI